MGDLFWKSYKIKFKSKKLTNKNIKIKRRINEEDFVGYEVLWGIL